MTNKKPIDKMANVTLTPIDIGYIAGLVDGDGWVGYHRHENAKTGKVRYKAAMRISGQCLPMVNFMMVKMGGSIWSKGKPCKSECAIVHVHARRQSYVWVSSNIRSILLMEILAPHMIEKREKTEGIIAQYHSQRHRHTTATLKVAQDLWDKGWPLSEPNTWRVIRRAER